jgi:integrase
VNKWITSKKFTGVRYKLLEDNDRSYQIRYKINSRLKEEVIGKKSEGITEQYCHQKRNEALNNSKFGDDAPIVKHKKKNFITVQSLADTYIEDTIDNKTNTKMLNKYNLHIKDAFGDMDIHTIEQSDIIKWRRSLTEGKAVKTANSIIELLSTIFNHSIKKGLKVVNPCVGVKKPKVNNQREKYLDIDEINQLKSVIKNNSTLYGFVLLALSTGGRRETVLHIRKQDINLKDGTVNLIDFKNGGETYTGFLEKETIDFLQSLNWSKLKPYDYIVGFSNTVFSSKTLSNKLAPILNELFNQGLDKNDTKHRTVIHTLRHTFASHLAINGTPIFTIKKLMNHHDIEMTMRYAKLAPDSGKENVFLLYDHVA